MSSTTDKSGPSRKQVLIVSVIVQLALIAAIWLGNSWFRSSMQFNPEELEKRSAEVQKRNKERIKAERIKREKVAIKESDAEKLRKKARKKQEKKAIDKVREMHEAREHIREQREASLAKLKNRSFDEVNQRKMDDLLSIAKKIADTSFHVKARSNKPISDQLYDQCQDLYTQTETVLEQGDWLKSKFLKNEAIELQTLITDKQAVITEQFPDSKEANKNYTHFLYFAPSILKHIDDYLAKLEELVTTQAELSQLNDLGEIPLELPELEALDLESMDLNQLVNQARQTEAEMTREFSEMRAAEMAQIESSTLAEALAKIAQAQQGSPLDSQSLPNPSDSQMSQQQPTTVGDLQKYRADVASMGRQATAHWTRAMNMAQQANALGSQGQAGRSSESFAQNSQSSPLSGQGQGKGGKALGGAGMDSGSKASDRTNLGLGSAFQARSSVSGIGLKGLRTNIPPEIIKAKALPGRRFRSESLRQGWLFIDTWYIIGPWENNGALDYDVTHPPEIAIDLDANYSDGKLVAGSRTKRHPLRWQFVQSDIMRITPPNEKARSTYYAYTEVYFDEPAKMLVAIATDDAARMWVNNQLVWQDEGLSGWNLNEGFRVIEFQKGFNKFLVRIENSPVLCEFSVLLCPPDQVQK